jgi:hypothetical protein
MQTNNFSAEYGRMAGGTMNMVLKSGTNQYHGTVFEFLRNDKVDARNFFDRNKSELRQNQFGASISGPLSIPKLYNAHDRTFFLFSWESLRAVTGSPALGVVASVPGFHRQGSMLPGQHHSAIAPEPAGAGGAGVLPAAQYHRSQQPLRLCGGAEQLRQLHRQARRAHLRQGRGFVPHEPPAGG